MDWSINPIFGSYGIVVVVGLGLLCMLLLVREAGHLTRWQSLCLWTLRLLMCLVLIVFLLRPGVTFVSKSSPTGTVAIVMDESGSMSLPSGNARLSRWEEQIEVLQQIWGARRHFDAQSHWATFLYSDALKPLANAKGGAEHPISVPASPLGVATDVAGPLNQLMAMNLESPLSAVVWMGDGAQTLTPASGDPLQTARRLAQLDVPLYLIGVGPRSDGESSRDLSVEGVPEQLDVFTQNPFNVLGTLRCRGVANQELNLRLLLRKSSEQPQEVARVRVRPSRNDEVIPFQLNYIAPPPGAYELTVEAIPVEREAVTENNSVVVYLNVREGGARVLYIEGEARFEMKFLRRSLGDSPDIDLLSLPINKPPVQKWPVDLRQQLARDVFDCIILGDVDFNAIGNEGATRIAELVRNGAGLITMGGYHSYGAGGWSQSALKDILPVQMGTAGRNTIDSKINLQDQIPGPIPVVLKGNPELLQIDAPEKNLETWRGLKPLLGANRWAGVKNNTVLLAESPNADPLIVAGTAGEGRVVSLAFDSTYVWVRQGMADAHKAFWRKLVYWCMRRKAVAQGLEMRMAQRRLLLSQPSEVIIDWVAGSSGLAMPQNVSLHLWRLPDGETGVPQDLGAVQTMRRDEMSLRASFLGTKDAGRYEWRAQATAMDGTVMESSFPFLVADRSIESLQPIPDWQLMEQMARLSEASGGGLYSADQMPELLEQLQNRREQSTETMVENRKLGEGLIDSWTAFLVIGTLMITQWGLRKRWNLP